MQEQLITFETAKLAKEKGFDSKYTEDYDTLGFVQQRGILESHNLERISAPTQSLLQKWLREEHKLHIVIIPTVTGHFTYKMLDIQLNPEKFIERPPYKDVASEDFTTYEKALEAGLQEALKMIK